MTKLTDEYLKEVLDYLAQSDAGSVKELRRHIDALTSELSQARAELAALRAVKPEREDAAAKAAKALFDVTLTKVTAAPQPPAQEDHGHAARLNRLLGILRRLKWVQNDKATMLLPAGPADALNDLGLFMFSDAIDRAVEADRLDPKGA